ncbi:MAG: hypothetical protein SF182_03760, partial [Deltaproteobacteria bacterium]|nr:hypothetical protein [Deltaproteobacteria bacterium]
GGASPGNAGSAGFGFGGSGGPDIPAIASGGAGGGGGYYGGGGTASAIEPGGGGGGSGYVTPRASHRRLFGAVRHVIVDGQDLFDGVVFVLWPKTPVGATVTLTADHDSPVARGTVVTLTARVAISTGAPAVGTVTISRYADGNGACPCSNVGQGLLDPDGSFSVRINPGQMSYGPNHVLVARFQDHYGVIGDTSSNPLVMNVLPSDQSIAFTSPAPGDAYEFGPTYTVAATASSGLAVSYSIAPASAAVCSIAGATVSFFGTGVCAINANQAGNAFYNAAPTAQQQVTVAAGGGQRITFTSTPPSNAVPDQFYTATASGGASGNPVVFSNAFTDPTCVVRSDGLVRFAFGGLCRILANQAGGNGLAAAPQAVQEIVVGPHAQQVVFTTTPPSSPNVDDTYAVSAYADSYLQIVALRLAASSTGCTLTNVKVVNAGGYFRTDATVTFTGAGTCLVNGDAPVVDAIPSGLPMFSAAPTAQQAITVGGPTASPTQTASDTPTETPSANPTETPTADQTPAVTGTPSPEVSATPTATATINADACAPLPRSRCQAPRRASEIGLRTSAPRLRWEWFGTQPTTAAGFGDPVGGASAYHLCIYDTADGLPGLVFGASVPAGGTCGTRPCWKQTRKRLAYTNHAATPDGIRHLALSAGGSRKAASIIVSGHGPHLRLPTPADAASLLRASPQVIVQLQRSDAPACWEAVFTAPARSNSAHRFEDRIR